MSTAQEIRSPIKEEIAVTEVADKMLPFIIRSIVLYGSEIWTFNK